RRRARVMRSKLSGASGLHPGQQRRSVPIASADRLVVTDASRTSPRSQEVGLPEHVRWRGCSLPAANGVRLPAGGRHDAAPPSGPRALFHDGIALTQVVTMRRYLVVANQTLHAAELREALRNRISAGPCSFFVIVPDTKATDYDAVAAGGVLPQPGMWWWATHYARPATDKEATVQARQRLSLMLAGLAAMGVPVEGDLGSANPLEAMEKVLADHQFDEI